MRLNIDMIREKNIQAAIYLGVLAVILAFVWKGGTVRAAGEVIELDLRNGSVEIEENRYRQNGANGGQYQEGQDFIITSGGEEVDCGIVVRGGEHKITFDNVNISRKQGTADAATCFAVTRVNNSGSAPRVYLTLTGNNTFHGIGSAVLVGMPAFPDAFLSITEDSTGVMTATGGNANEAAGIQSYGTLEINGGTITVNGGQRSAGIGAESNAASGNRVVIKGGHVTAVGGDGAAGIGGDYGNGCGNIEITGGYVEATGGKGPTWPSGSMGTGSGAGIGSGSVAGSDSINSIQVGTITINGGYVSAKSGGTDAAGIGVGGSVSPSGELVSDRTGNAWIEADSLKLGTGSGTDGTNRFLGGVLFSGDEGKIYGTTYTLSQNIAISQGKKLTVDAGKVLYIPKKHILTLSGTDSIAFGAAAAGSSEAGSIVIDSRNCLAGNGDLGSGGNYYLFSDDFEGPQDLIDKGEDQTESVKTKLEDSFKAACRASLKGRQFTNPPYNLTLRPATVRNAGAYTATFTTVPFNRTIEKTFRVYSDDTAVKMEVTTPPDKVSYVDGDNFDPAGMVVTVTYRNGRTEDITDDISITNGTGLRAGQTSVTIAYTGRYDEDLECEARITVGKKKIDLSGIEWNEEDTTFEYDGEPYSPIFDEELLPEGVEMAVTGTGEATDAGTHKVTVEFRLKPGYEDRYMLDDAGGTVVSRELEWTIRPKELEWDTTDLEAVGNTRDDEANIYGELGVSGVVDSDIRDGNVNTSYSTENITGIHDKVAGEDKDISLEWKNEDDKLSLEGSAAGNYHLPEELPVVSGSVNEVEEIGLPPELEPADGMEYRMDLETRISKVPDGLISDYETPGALEGRLVEEVVKRGVAPGYITSYDLTLLSRGEGDTGWQRAEASAVPSAGLTVNMPYPEGITGDKYNGVVAYIYPETINGVEAGTVVYLRATKTDDGIRFTIPAPAMAGESPPVIRHRSVFIRP